MSDLCRAKTKDGEEVVGWYFAIEDKHYLILDDAIVEVDEYDFERIHGFIEIDHATAAFDAGKDAKNGRIYGSKGEFQGGDRVRATIPPGYDPEGDLPEDRWEATCEWLDEDLTWILRKHKNAWHYFSDLPSSQLEIIPKESE